MKAALGVFGLLIILNSCAKPVADFIVSTNSTTVPSELTVKSTAAEADTIIWTLNGDQYKGDSVWTKNILHSGRYVIGLIANKGNKSSYMEKEIILDSPTECLVQLRTRFGNMLIKLYDETPKHRDNFVKLVEQGYYDGLLFHRIISGFMVQGGDPSSKAAQQGERLGSGGPGYQIDAEFSRDLVHLKGALAAARTGDQVNPQKKSSGSQFYIVQGSPVEEWQLAQVERRRGLSYPEEIRSAYLDNGGTPFLDMEYTVFGQVIKGLDVLDKLSSVETDPSDRPLDDVKMEIVLIK